MIINPYRSLALAALFILSVGFTHAAGGFLHQNEKIVFDKTNFLVFEDVGRKETEHSISFGQKILLHATRDDKAVDYDLGVLRVEKRVPLSTQVMEIRYRDKDRIWIIARLGHRLDGAVLYNLATKKPDWMVSGKFFSLSPDAVHLAYTFPWDRYQNCPAVFVNTVMVYPKVEPGFTRSTELDSHQKEDGTGFEKFIPRDSLEMAVASEIKWLGKGELEFAVRPANDNGKNTKKSAQKKQTIRVSGLEDLTKPEGIKISVKSEAGS